MKAARKGGGGCPSQRMRASKAAFGLALALAAVCFIDVPGSLGRVSAGVRATSGANSALTSAEGADAADLGEGAEKMVFDLFEGCAGPALGEEGAVPDGFGEEVADPQAIGCAWTVCEGSTAALYFEAPLQVARKGVEGQMEDNGWTEVQDASGDYCSTFVKGSGRYRWAYVVYSEVSSDSVACFTLQGAAAEQERR